jgi:hypothetical protein
MRSRCQQQKETFWCGWCACGLARYSLIMAECVSLRC